MILVLTMAGKYMRFREQGYKLPKYLMPWGNKSILSEILNQFLSSNEFSEVFLVINSQDEPYFPHVIEIMNAYNISRKNLLITKDTEGQAETACIGIQGIKTRGIDIDVPVVFHNIDTILYCRNFREIRDCLQSYDGFIDIFHSNCKSYSYVLLDDQKKVIDVAEKILISDMATSGLYGFKNISTFEKNYVPKRDLYISSIYESMIQSGLSISVSSLHLELDTVVLGTPEEYLNASSTLLHHPKNA